MSKFNLFLWIVLIVLVSVKIGYHIGQNTTRGQIRKQLNAREQQLRAQIEMEKIERSLNGG